MLMVVDRGPSASSSLLVPVVATNNSDSDLASRRVRVIVLMLYDKGVDLPDPCQGRDPCQQQLVRIEVGLPPAAAAPGSEGGALKAAWKGAVDRLQEETR